LSNAYAMMKRRPIVRADQKNARLAMVAIGQNLRGTANRIIRNPQTPAIV